MNQYGPKFPKVVRLQEQLKDLDTLVTTEKKNIGNQIEAEYRGSRQRELLLQQALDQQKTETSSMADKMVQYNILQHDAEANKQLYDGLLQKLKEAGISAGLRSSNIRVVDPAFVPGGPSDQINRGISLSRFWWAWSEASAWRYCGNIWTTPSRTRMTSRNWHICLPWR